MHIQARQFTLFVKSILPEYFFNKKVLDVGSGDINGNNFFLFENCEYEGNDVIKADNVTIVSKTKDLPFQDNTFDTITSTECFEHDPEYEESLLKIYKMLKPNGLFFFTCASTLRGEHGTRRSSPESSYGTIGNLVDMFDYYKNITEIDLNKILNLDQLFSAWDTYYNSESRDLYFIGIKNGKDNNLTELKKYKDNFVKNTSHRIKLNEEWIFYEELDSFNHDINYIPHLSVDSMKMEGEYMNSCVAFNTFGFFKSKIEFPLIRSNYYGYDKREGIYIKKSYLERILLNEDKNQWICNLTDIHTEEYIYNKYISNKINNQKLVCFIHNCKIGCNKENEILDVLLNTISDNNDFLDFIDLIIINNFGEYLDPNFYKNDKILILNYSTFTNQYEIPTLRLINYFSNQNSDMKLLYLHSKGVSYDKNNINYYASINWNKYMLYFLVKKYKRCIELLDSFDTVGCNYVNNNQRPKHYSGNFWWANTNYIKKLSISQLKSKYDGEFWLLSNNDVNISNLFNLEWQNFDKPHLYEEIKENNLQIE
jgi:SAM-dependent methyltransferase